MTALEGLDLTALDRHLRDVGIAKALDPLEGGDGGATVGGGVRACVTATTWVDCLR